MNSGLTERRCFKLALCGIRSFAIADLIWRFLYKLVNAASQNFTTSSAPSGTWVSAAGRIEPGAEILLRQRRYWPNNTHIGYVFRLGLIVRLVVGSIVVYQTLSSDANEHTAEYAMLKALVYAGRFPFGPAIQESLILSILGFLPVLVLSQVVKSIASWSTLPQLYMEPIRVTLIYLQTAGMGILSGALAMRRLRKADSAEIF